MADVDMAEYFTANAYVRVAMVLCYEHSFCAMF